MKMGKEILMFTDIEIEKNKFYRHKSSTFLKNINTEKVLVSNKISSGEKDHIYFIGYLYNSHEVFLYFLIEEDDLLEKYNTIWNKVSADVKKNLITNLNSIKNF